VYVIATHFMPTANILNSTQTELDDNQDATDFFDIPMDGIQKTNELDEYLSQAIKKVKDPIAWWWDHQKVYPWLSVMALDYLSIPDTCSVI
jgi:hAT family C-terminal dimerisation region